MESAHDSIKYIEPIYNNVMNDDASKTHARAKLDDNDLLGKGVMYEQQESRWATEMVEAALSDSNKTVTFVEPYIDGYSAMYNASGAPVAVQYNGTWVVIDTTNITSISQSGNVATITATTSPVAKAVGRFDSDQDLVGDYLGEVELKMKDYHFEPRIISLGVTWTQLAELVLDTSFGVSAEEMLMDYAAQEIKKTLDYQSVKYASAMQKAKAADNYVEFNAQAADAGSTKDSYYHTAQLIGQSIDQIADKQLNAIGRGGVTAIVGGPKAVTYLKLNKLWSDTGRQPAIGGHKVGELDGIPVFKVPAGIVGDDELLTTWKNETAEGDVSVAIGTLMPFYTTGAIQRKNLYKEAAVARFEDMKALQPKYLGRIKITNIR